jgi:hypothetical protein
MFKNTNITDNLPLGFVVMLVVFRCSYMTKSEFEVIEYKHKKVQISRTITGSHPRSANIFPKTTHMHRVLSSWPSKYTRDQETDYERTLTGHEQSDPGDDATALFSISVQFNCRPGYRLT